jgi:hypothetical protein
MKLRGALPGIARLWAQFHVNPPPPTSHILHSAGANLMSPFEFHPPRSPPFAGKSKRIQDFGQIFNQRSYFAQCTGIKPDQSGLFASTGSSTRAIKTPSHSVFLGPSSSSRSIFEFGRRNLHREFSRSRPLDRPLMRETDEVRWDDHFIPRYTSDRF